MVFVGDSEGTTGKAGLCLTVSQVLAGRCPLPAIQSQIHLQRALSEPPGSAHATHTSLWSCTACPMDVGRFKGGSGDEKGKLEFLGSLFELPMFPSVTPLQENPLLGGMAPFERVPSSEEETWGSVPLGLHSSYVPSFQCLFWIMRRMAPAPRVTVSTRENTGHPPRHRVLPEAPRSTLNITGQGRVSPFHR